jgi:predicted DCC family thiol-disulfide oxidoreductase YuxK
VGDQLSTLPPRIVLYDGVCGLCHRTVRWLLARDREGRFRFAPLQGETAALLRARHPEIPKNLDSVVFVEEERVHLRSRAFVHAARHLGRPWRWAYVLRIIPAPLLDLAYRLIARIRYRVWGRFDECRVPDAAERERLMP